MKRILGVDSMIDSRLSFLFVGEKALISFSPADSDIWRNLVIMEQVVGTLVKYNSQGVYDPYLAKKWFSSADEKTWQFILQEGLKTEDGIAINATTYARNLKILLAMYSKTQIPPTFSKLKGWTEFLNGNDDALGIKALSEFELTFEFETRPSGVLEFLSMPYYGFYSPNDFDGTKWRDSLKIHSSGAYYIKLANADSCTLIARKDWYNLNNHSPKQVDISFSEMGHISKDSDSKFKMIAHRVPFFDVDEKFVSFKSTPTLLASILLSPYVYPFDDSKVREAFRTVVRSISSKTNWNAANFQKTNFFYEGFFEYSIKDLAFDEAIRILQSVQGPPHLKVFTQKIATGEKESFLAVVLSEVIKEIGWTLEYVDPSNVGDNWREQVYKNKLFPIRLANVDTGGNPENWVIDMMFCSTLGISFPDHLGSVCELVKKYESGHISDRAQYWRLLHSSIEKSSTVIPMFRTGFSWLATENISVERLGPSISVPRFDLLELN